MMKGMLVLVLLLMIAPAVSAEVYHWEDSRGVVHFTDNQDKIPLKDREKAQVMDVGPGGNEASPAGRRPFLSEPAAGLEKRYGGNPEGWWRSRFSVLHQELQATQERLVAKKEEQAVLRRKRVIYHRAKDRVAYNAVVDEITVIEGEITEIQARLAKLESVADEAEVPAAWRR